MSAPNLQTFVWENTSCKIFPGFYYTLISGTSWIEDILEEDSLDICHLEKNGEPVPDYYYRDYEDFDRRVLDRCPKFWVAYDTLVSKAWAHLLWEKVQKESLDSIITAMEYDHLWSPTYYNYTTDKLNLRITCDMDALESYIQKNEEDFRKYLKDHRTSCDGFISLVPNTLEELRESKYYRDTCIEYLLRSMMLNDLDEYYDSIEYNVYEFMSELSVGYVAGVASDMEEPKLETCESGEEA